MRTRDTTDIKLILIQVLPYSGNFMGFNFRRQVSCNVLWVQFLRMNVSVSVGAYDYKHAYYMGLRIVN